MKSRPMRRTLVLIVMGITLASTGSAHAINEFKLGFMKKYAGDDAPAEFKTAVESTGCNLCHVRGKAKQERNEYGMALSKWLKKADFQGAQKRFEGAAAEKAIAEGLDKAEKEKSGSGKTFAEIIKQGKLPAASQ